MTRGTATLEARIRELAAAYRPLAVEILREAVRIPHDYVDRPVEQGGDPRCGLSNHEGPRLEYLRRMLVEHACVARPEDASFDDYGNLVWTVHDPEDGIEPARKKVIYMDGHTDTVAALREQWHEKLGGMDPYLGVTDWSRVDKGALRDSLGYLPPEDEWDYMVFGRGVADQLGGVVAQMIATKILLELRPLGALRGAIVRSIATAAEEDNDGGGPMFFMNQGLAGAPPERIPDAVILSEGTGDSAKGAVGIYRGQRGRMQIEVEVIGRSCHGSMPWEGLNPLEYGARIIVEAREQYDAREGFKEHDFLGHGTRTASWARLETPSDCAVPDAFVWRFDRRLTVGETPEDALAAIEGLPAVAKARADGLTVHVRVPRYEEPTWKGYTPGNPMIYWGWLTPEDHPAIEAARRAYADVVSPLVPADSPQTGGALRKECRVDRWIFSTDGVGFIVPADPAERGYEVPESKGWIRVGDVVHPPMFGCGPGIEQNTHKIGEAMDSRELMCAIAFLAAFPSRFVQGG
ncbi:MAG: M20/M25/M40 family metallo-hydrolase [Planctomycetota bacterium]|nr:MAG: M20/M25/M40 family metallo-hydrolase [Planctomycetota bacterium]